MRQLLRITFGAAVAVALGFGAAQAAPSAPRTTPDRACPEDCNAYCQSIGGSGGYCSGRVCLCFF